ncbi:hypothetical protein [Mitsuaria sp. PDC51]|uniref:hypothetical protein n=1 Tax=Mitsuaria sp. PDC51 TaxID=1881035 RepID=UPI0011401CD7|nr:hypothetical protein [Mitsuaria sp. PDC51]
MWWAGKRSASRTAVAYVGEEAVRVAAGGTVLAAAKVEGRDAALVALAAAVRELPRGTRLQVTVSGTVCRPFLLPAVEGVASEAEWQAIAASMVEESTGLPAESPLWLDGVQAAPRLAVAMDPAWRQGIEAIGGRSLRGVRPWWALAIESVGSTRADGGSAGLAVADSESLVLLIAEGDTYRVAQSYALEGEAPAAVLNRALVSHDGPADGVPLIEFDGVALPGQRVDEHLAFRKGGVA